MQEICISNLQLSFSDSLGLRRELLCLKQKITPPRTDSVTLLLEEVEKLLSDHRSSPFLCVHHSEARSREVAIPK